MTMMGLIEQIPMVWLLAVAALILAGATWGLVYYLTYAVRSQLLGKTIWRGQSATNAVALTFDDGPSDDTGAILDILDRYQVKAAFFMIGRQVERFPAIAQRVARDGHEIGNHSLSHPIFLFQRPGSTQRQLERSQKVISEATGVTPAFARPPCGVRTPAYFKAARRLGLRTVQWSVAGFDWRSIPAAKIADHVLKDIGAGSIILLHDGDDKLVQRRMQTAQALPAIIEGIWAKNLRIAPLREVCGEY